MLLNMKWEARFLPLVFVLTNSALRLAARWLDPIWNIALVLTYSSIASFALVQSILSNHQVQAKSIIAIALAAYFNWICTVFDAILPEMWLKLPLIVTSFTVSHFTIGILCPPPNSDSSWNKSFLLSIILPIVTQLFMFGVISDIFMVASFVFWNSSLYPSWVVRQKPISDAAPDITPLEVRRVADGDHQRSVFSVPAGFLRCLNVDGRLKFFRSGSYEMYSDETFKTVKLEMRPDSDVETTDIPIGRFTSLVQTPIAGLFVSGEIVKFRPFVKAGAGNPGRELYAIISGALWDLGEPLDRGVVEGMAFLQQINDLTESVGFHVRSIRFENDRPPAPTGAKSLTEFHTDGWVNQGPDWLEPGTSQGLCWKDPSPDRQPLMYFPWGIANGDSNDSSCKVSSAENDDDDEEDVADDYEGSDKFCSDSNSSWDRL